jgi:Ser-tRNA(Ala) deacylase AlaX
MTKLLYQTDSYIHDFSTTVTGKGKINKRIYVELDA